jgi:hypothetical protein
MPCASTGLQRVRLRPCKQATRPQAQVGKTAQRTASKEGDGDKKGDQYSAKNESGKHGSSFRFEKQETLFNFGLSSVSTWGVLS